MVSTKFVDSLVTLKEFYFLFYITLLTIIFLGFLMISGKRIKFSLNLTDVAIILFYLYCITRILVSDTFQFKTTFFHIQTGMVLVYFFLRVLFTGEGSLLNIKIIILGILTFSAIQVVYGFLQLWEFISPAMNNFKVGGSFGNPGPFSNYIVLILPVSLGIGLFGTKQSKLDFTINRLGYWSAILIILLLPATKARTAWIATIIAISIILLKHGAFSLFIKRVSQKLAAKVLLILGAICVLATTGYYLYQYKPDSANGRLFIWEITSRIIVDKPLTGSGYNSFQATHNNYQAKFFEVNGTDTPEAKLADNSSFAFNEFLQVTSELGIIGLLFFSLLFISIFLKKNGNLTNELLQINNLALISIITCIIVSLFSYPFHDIPTLLNLFILLALASSIQNQKVFSFQMNRIWYVLPAIALIAGLCWYMNLLKERYQASKEWHQASVMIREQPKLALESYQKVYPVLKYNGYFLYNYGAELSLANEHNKAIEVLNEALPLMGDGDVYTYLGNSYDNLGNLQLAEESFLKAHYLVPHKIYPLYRLVYVYAKEGNLTKATELANQIITADVKVYSQVTHDIKAEMTDFINRNQIINSEKQ